MSSIVGLFVAVSAFLFVGVGIWIGATIITWADPIGGKKQTLVEVLRQQKRFLVDLSKRIV